MGRLTISDLTPLLPLLSQVGRLTISGLTRADSGLYDCSASNSGGQDTAPGHLTVQYRPVLSGPEQAEIFTWHNHTAELRCTVDAEPAAEVGWTVDGRGLEGDQHVQQTQDGDTSVLKVSMWKQLVDGEVNVVIVRIRVESSGKNVSEYRRRFPNYPDSMLRFRSQSTLLIFIAIVTYFQYCIFPVFYYPATDAPPPVSPPPSGDADQPQLLRHVQVLSVQLDG